MIVISTLKFHVRKILILLFLISTTVLLLIFKRYSATNNKSDIIIAVLDTGVNLKRKIFSSLIQGYDVINDNNKIQDDNGHGTIVASIINRIEPKLKIMPIKAIPKSGFTDREYLAKGIIKAVDAGANIINISCGIVSSDKKLLDAVNYAEKNDVLIVAAVGNEGKYDSIQYPAAYDNVLAVGAVDDMNRRLELSNWGGQIDVVARGYEVSAIGLNGDKKYVSGTSASTPIVSAIAGKILIQRPDINVKELRKIIKYMAKDINTYGWDEDTGYGLMYENMDIYIYNNRKLIATIDDNSVYDSEKYLLNYNDINQYNICIGNFLNTNETGKYELFINYTPIPK